MILEPPGCSPSHLEISSTIPSRRRRVSPLPGEGDEVEKEEIHKKYKRICHCFYSDKRILNLFN
jgi:hypothetical protein